MLQTNFIYYFCKKVIHIFICIQPGQLKEMEINQSITQNLSNINALKQKWVKMQGIQMVEMNQ